MLTMRKLGKYGRFANQLFQYAFLRIHANDYQCPAWHGQAIFGLKDPPVTVQLPQVKETGIYKAEDSKIIGRDNIDIVGYFQYHTSYYAAHKDFIRTLFTPRPEYEDHRIALLQQKGFTVIGLHIRRGDYGTFRRKSARWAFRAPCKWYRDWLDKYMPANSILFIATDGPHTVLPEFSPYQYELSNGGVYADFYWLTQCDILLISNSSFGFMASMLNTRLQYSYRPRLSKRALIPYDPWDAHTVLRDETYAVN